LRKATIKASKLAKHDGEGLDALEASVQLSLKALA